MTHRLYYEDPYRVEFAAQVLERVTWEGRPAVVLDRTAFYATGGGQPHDTGSLDGIPVIDVAEREPDGAVIHVLSAPLAHEQVAGRIDWARRFDLMQQHTGQHILSSAVVRRIGATTVGFHLSEEYATIDLDRAPISGTELDEIEWLANAAITEDRPVRCRFVPDEEVATLPLRKPVHHAGPVRIVEVAGFDWSACGGTHVRATGEIGLLKITRAERRGAETRLEFLCGGRALRDYRAKHALLVGLAGQFTVSHWELPDLVQRQAQEIQETRQELRRARDALLDAEAARLIGEAEPTGAFRLVQANLPGRSPEDLKHLAQRALAHPRTVVLLGSSGEALPAGPGSPTEPGKAYLVFARSADVDLPLGNLLRQACELVGGRGGGRPDFAQGGGPHGDRVGEALESAARVLRGTTGP